MASHVLRKKRLIVEIQHKKIFSFFLWVVIKTETFYYDVNLFISRYHSVLHFYWVIKILEISLQKDGPN